MWLRFMVFGVVGSVLAVAACAGQITYYIDERGRRVYVNAEEPPKKAEPAPQPKRTTRNSVLVRRDPHTGKMIPVPPPPEPAEQAAQQPATQRPPSPATAETARPQSPAPAAEPMAASKNMDDIISGTAERHAVDPDLVRAIVKVESNFNPDAVSRKGAMGLMQLIPGTARRFGVSDIFNPEENVDGGVRYLKYLLGVYNGNLRLSLAAYNAGEKAVDRHNGIPPYPETKQYVNKISSLYQSGYIVNPFGISGSSSQRRQQVDRWGIMKRRDEKGTVHFSNTEGW